MIFIRLILALVAITMSGQAFALSDEALFQHARESYAAKNETALTEDVSQLKTQQYLLTPYAEYWLMLLKLDKARDEEVQNFIAQYVDMPFAERLRGEWLKRLAKQQNWGSFFDELAFYQQEDIAVQCYALLGHKQLGDVEVASQARALWMSTADLPSNCNQLFDVLQKTGELSNDDIWARFRLALQEDKLSLAKSVISRLANIDPAALKLLDRANQLPQLMLDKKTASFKTRFGAEVNLYALDRLARTKIDEAISTYGQVQNLFNRENRAFGWGRIAYHAARSHHPRALSYYALAEGVTLDNAQLAWKVRAALRAQDWATVLHTTSAMPAKQIEEGAWRYWKARALKETAQKEPSHIAEANAILSKLSAERHYYGLLAAEELDSVMSNPAVDYKVTDIEVAAIASQPSMKRVLELQRLEMRWEAKLEWIWATRSYDDKQLLAAAEYAMRQKWYDIAIKTADNTKVTHNFNLRYPTPYRDLFRTAADNVSVDEAWVYGISRQESRFMHFARSGVGAAGLMQLMPATAQWVAKRMGLNGYNNTMIRNLNTNIEFGTYYMRYTLDLMGGQTVMATAGYNAGPSRAKQWMATEPLEASIYIETIPFAETRTYVQKVMANTQIYAPRLVSENNSIKIQTLKSRLGVVPGTGQPEVVVEDAVTLE
jgi:soluble lytic murein transglycosylase